jgi:hypothetical protein
MSCLGMERKSSKVLKRRITEVVAAVTCDMLRRVWEELVIDLTSSASHVGLTSSACKV